PQATAKTIGPGENFIIGTQTEAGLTGGGGVLSSDFRLDEDADSSTTTDISYRAVAPAWSEADPPGAAGNDVATARAEVKAPLVDFDLCHPQDRATGQHFEEHGSAVGYFLHNAGTLTTATACELVLKRKMNPQADGIINDTANDWIEIDRVTINRRLFAINATDDHTAVQTAFTNLRSEERREPFYANGNGFGVEDETSSNGFFKHTLGAMDLTDTDTTLDLQNPTNYIAAPNIPVERNQRNSVQPIGQAFRIWQPHFDRGFTSVYDLLSVLTIGPESLIYHDRTAGSIEGGLVRPDMTQMTGIHSAAVRFMNPMGVRDWLGLPHPDFPTHLASIPEIANEHHANSWYRLFEFLSVPSHTSDEVADRMASRRRVPGKINLNTVRTENNLAAVINDRDQLINLQSPYFPADPYLPADDVFMPSGLAPPHSPTYRNWYLELRRSRDGVDTLFAANNRIYPPGTPFANPFRPLTYEDGRDLDTANGGVQANPLLNLNSTILRRHHGTAGSNLANIGLFEARNPTDVTADTIDWHTRNRILSRIANLTTNRSHVYVIFGGFQLHEAYEASPNDDIPNVRIGARMTSEPVYRELIVVDMSRLEEAYDTATGAFNFEGFILHREVLP
ncbi:MAG: hypothetical protein ACK5Q5_23725, partial [Planctomycetaceae bacterium]